MKAPAVLVPFKGGLYKSRLSPVLDAGQRREFAYLLLDGVLETVRKAVVGRRCYVVSSDPEAQETARRAGVQFLREQSRTGVNGAVRFAVRRLRAGESFVVIPSDLALLSPGDVRKALGFGRIAQLVIAPSSSFNGTNLLLFPRRMATALSYDDDSFWNHLAAGARLGLRTVVLTQKGLVFDVDTPADAEELARSRINTGAARFLRKSLAK
ncbi:MAG: 2-phospho-L-lactate guanylyltransferase [Nitrososphaerota archaeon]|nr:2-phospho-L-lactate guanylyltransferase [Nitrososphaerota archaeon]